MMMIDVLHIRIILCMYTMYSYIVIAYIDYSLHIVQHVFSNNLYETLLHPNQNNDPSSYFFGRVFIFKYVSLYIIQIQYKENEKPKIRFW